MRTRLAALLPVIFVLALIARPGHGQSWPIGALAGIQQLECEVPALSPAAIQGGLRETTLKADVELRLRHEGIYRGSPRNDPLKAPPVIRVTVEVHPREVGASAFTVFRLEISLLQHVGLLREPAVVSTLPTWMSSVEGTELAPNLVRSVRVGLNDLLNQFFHERRIADSRPCDPWHTTPGTVPNLGLPGPPLE